MTECDQAIVEAMLGACLSAAAHLVNAIEQDACFTEEVKSDGSLVLNLDTECQEIILEVLGSRIPVAAEEAPETYSLIGSRDPYFIVDPIDGTLACKRFFRERGGQSGFGPLIGFVKNGQVTAASFYQVPTRTLYFTRVGEGVSSLVLENPEKKARLPLESLSKLSAPDLRVPLKSAVLFYSGTEGEFGIAEELRKQGFVEAVYRFGGFANDCVRLANGFEDAIVQFRVKAWDAPAVLFCSETGYEIVFDPCGQQVMASEWKLQEENPLIIGRGELLNKLLSIAVAGLKQV